MSDRAPYSRVYWSIVDDPKFSTIFDDDHHLATWLRLLVIADQAHPASANIPSGTRKSSIEALVTAGLVDLGTSYRYRIHGLDAERSMRREAATRYRSGDQPGPNGEVTGFVTTGRRRDELRRDETSTASDPNKESDAARRSRKTREYLDGLKAIPAPDKPLEELVPRKANG